MQVVIIISFIYIVYIQLSNVCYLVVGSQIVK